MSLTTTAPPHEAESKAAAEVVKVAGTTEARISEDDAKSARKLRERKAALEFHGEKLKLKKQEREDKADAKAKKRTQSNERRDARRRARIARAAAAYTRVRDYVTGNMPGVYSTGIYAMALYVAVSGQLSMATERGWSPVFGVGMAAFLEGTALSMALTAHQLRLKGERALVPTAMTWVAAGFASAINFLAHRQDPILAVVLGASSLAAIIVWEVRSGAKHRDALRKLGLIPEPPERFGIRRWLRFPRSTFKAWSMDVRDRVSVGAAALLARVEHDAETAAAATSAATAQIAQIGATLAFGAAAEQAGQAKAAAAEAVKAARAAAPRRGFFARFKRAAKHAATEAVTELAPAARAIPAADEQPRPPKPATARPAEGESRAPKPTPPKRRTRADFTRVQNLYVELYVENGKAPSLSDLAAPAETPGRSTIHDWMRANPTTVAELKARAEKQLAEKKGPSA